MPQKKKGRNNNNNKKKRGAGHGRNRTQRAPAPATANTGIPANVLQGRTPDFQKFVDNAEAIQQSYPTMYTRYKTATKRFFNYMHEHAPDDLKGDRSVNSLLPIADWMANTGHVLHDGILRDLKLAIRMRKRVAKSIFGGGDAGHKHFLDVLVYCFVILVALPRETTVAAAGDEEEAPNRYAALQEDMEDEDEDDEELFPAAPVPRPEPEAEPLSLDDLIHSDDRNDVILFLLTLDELMGAVVQQYQAVAKNVDFYRRSRVPKTAIMEEILEAAVAANMAIEQVQQLEMEFEVQHPHMTTPYRLLSTLVLPDVTQHFTAIVREHATQPCREQDIIALLGDCLECSFRNPSDPENKKDIIVPEFCARFGISDVGKGELELYVKGIHMMVIMEVPVGSEQRDNKVMADRYQREIPGFSSHSWLPTSMPHISGDRAIHHTIRLLQAFGAIVKGTPHDQNILARKGFFGPTPWRPGRSKTIHNDLDELLMADILPSWVLLCRHGILGKAKLPRTNELAPLWVCLKNYFDAPERPLKWSLIFSVHAMLTAVLETDRVFDELLLTTKNVFDTYFRQVEYAADLKAKEQDSVVNPTYGQNMFAVLFLKNLGLPVFGNRSIWNPLCGGTIFSYTTYFGNMDGGSSLIDDRAQLRITLHLYHALRLNGILRKNEVPLLDLVYDAFRNSRAIWEGPPPKKGQFVERFWVAFGCNRSDAKQLARSAKDLIQNNIVVGHTNEIANGSIRHRQMIPLDAADISKSFRRICNRDFHDVVDKYHTPEQRKRNRGSDFYVFTVRMNDTLDAIDDEQALLSFNLSSLAVLLEQFVCSLSRIMQWDPIITQAMVSEPGLGVDKRPGTAHMFAQLLLGALDFAPTPMDYELLGIPMGTASSHFMREFFNRLDMSHVQIFQAVREEE